MDSIFDACCRGDLDYIKNHVGGHNVNRCDSQGKYLLEYATIHHHAHIAQFLIGMGANVVITRLGNTPLIHAAQYGEIEIAQALLNAEANINAQSVTGDTALLSAVKADDTKMIRFLLQNGARIEQRRHGATPLMTACVYGHICAAGMLLAYGARHKSKIMSGVTPFEYALFSRKYQLCELLIALGASRDVIVPENTSDEIMDLIRNPLPLQRICHWKIWIQSIRNGDIF